MFLRNIISRDLLNMFITKHDCLRLICPYHKFHLGRNLSSDDSLEQDNNYVTAYDEDTAVEICRILINRGGSVSGNPVHEMRPLHIAIRREWMILSRILLEHGS